jgi:hypothetical protein
MAEVKKATKKRTVKAEPEGHVHIQASFNNIIITFSNKTGQTISWSSAGRVGFKGSKRILRMRHKLQPGKRRKLLTMQVCENGSVLLKDQAQEEKLPSVVSIHRVLMFLLFVM